MPLIDAMRLLLLSFTLFEIMLRAIFHAMIAACYRRWYYFFFIDSVALPYAAISPFYA